jgi:galactokinase
VPRERVPCERAGAFAPGRVNLIGEHTDYNQGLALPFAIAEGIAVHATTGTAGRISARALDLDEEDEFALAEPTAANGWRAIVHGVVAELSRAGFPVVGARLEIGGDLPRGAGLSSSAALEVALCLALLALSDASSDPLELAHLCSRVESKWVGAQTGLLDQLASLCGAPDMALQIDFQTFTVDPISLRLEGGWRLMMLDSGERHANASSGYNKRRAECSRACELLGVGSLRETTWDSVERLAEPLRRRARHVLDENARVQDAVLALRAGDLAALGALLNASHRSLRDQYEVSTPTVELAVKRLHRSGAVGARIVGGGFGGHVLGLFPPGAHAPADTWEVRPGPGAHLLNGRATGPGDAAHITRT